MTAAASASANDAMLSDLMPGVRMATSACLATAVATTFFLAEPIAAAAVTVGAAVSGAVLPDLVLARAARAAVYEARNATATAVDALAAAVSAGVSLREGLELTAGHAPPALAAAFRAIALRLAAGSDPRDAFTVESARFAIPALVDLGEAVDRQRRLGAPLSAELIHIATRLRAQERTAVLERAARRGPLATLIVALIVAPACLAALTACLVGGFIESGALGLR